MAQASPLNREKLPVVFQNHWRAESRYNTSIPDRALYTTGFGQDIIDIYTEVGNRFAICTHLPSGNAPSTGGNTPMDERGLDSSLMPPPQWASMDLFRKNGFRDIVEICKARNIPKYIYGSQQKLQTNADYTTLDPTDIWMAPDTGQQEYLLTKDDEETIEFMKAAIYPFIDLGVEGYICDNNAVDELVLFSGGEINKRDSSGEFYQWLKEQGILHGFEAMPWNDGIGYDSDHWGVPAWALYEFMTHPSRDELDVPLPIDTNRHLWIERTDLSESDYTGSTLNSGPGTFLETLEQYVEWGYFISIYKSTVAGGPAIYNWWKNHVVQPFIEDIYIVSGTNEVTFVIYPGTEDWGTFTEAVSGDLTFTINELPRGISSVGAATVDASNHNRLTQTVRIQNPLLTGEDVLVDIAAGAWATDGTQSTRAQSRYARYVTASGTANWRREGEISYATSDWTSTIDLENLGTAKQESFRIYNLDENNSLKITGIHTSGSYRGQEVITLTITNSASNVTYDAGEDTYTIAPKPGGDGGYVQIDVDFSPTEVSADMFWLTVFTDDLITPEIKQRFSTSANRGHPAVIVAEYNRSGIAEEMSPSDTYNLGNASPSTPATEVITVRNVGDATMTFTSTTVNGTGLSISDDLHGETLEVGESIDFSVSYNPATSSDFVSGNIRLNHDGDSESFTLHFTSIPDDEESWVSREDMVSVITSRLANPSGCWSDYNKHFRAVEALNRIASPREDSFIKPGEVPAEPDPNDFDNLDC